MHTWGKALAATALLLCAQAPVAMGADSDDPVVRAPGMSGRAIPDQYVVTMADTAATEHAISALGIKPLFVYRSALRGFAAKLSAEQVSALRAAPGFVSIDQDMSVRVESVGSWGLDRIDQRDLPLNSAYTVNHDGSNVNAYIIDTGIDVNHPEFGGRARVGHDSVGDGQNGRDCIGHGTHVAGIAGSATFGVAKRVNLVAVRVVDCTGVGVVSGLLDGIDWVSANAVQPAVANISITGPAFDAVDKAVNHLTERVFTVVAASNWDDVACRYSPGRAAGAFTVGATTTLDGFGHYSNYGPCVQLLAPGSDIMSTFPNGQIGPNTGTSMAAPHVTGVVALYKQVNADSSVTDIRDWLWHNAIPNRIQFPPPPPGTPNLLLSTAGL